MIPLLPGRNVRGDLRRLAWVGLALLLPACDKPAAKPSAPPGLPVTVLAALPQRLPIALEAVGQSEGSREVEIRARVSGIVEKRLYTEGAPVQAGAVLFEIDRAPYEIAAAQARAALAQERVRAEQARRESERLKTLVESRAISQREYDAAQSALDQSTAAIEGAQAKLAEAELNLSYTKVTAPIGGVTGRAARSEGSLVTANTESSLLTTVTQVNPIWVRFSLAAPDFERIRGAAKRTRVNLLNADGTVAADNGRLNFTGSTVDSKLATVELRAEFPNRTRAWLPGQFVKVQILAGEQEAFLVPQSAVLQTEQARQVWIVDAEGKANLKPVQTAGWIGDNWIVTSGLAPGDRVIVDNLMKLRPNTPVQPKAPDSAPAAAPGAASEAPKSAAPAAQR